MAILTFATIGQLSHDHHVSLGGYAADALPLLAAWFVVAYAARRFVPTWLLGVTLGVVARMIALGHYHWDQLTFLVVALVFVGLVAWPVQWGARRYISNSRTWFKERTRFGPEN